MVIGRRSLLLAGAALPVSAYGQCVTDQMVVDACRGGVRLTRPAGATLDLDFMSPGSLNPLITFARASTGTYFDSAGVMRAAAVNAPRFDYDPVTLQPKGLLLEDQRTNLLLNSATLSTQSVTVTAQAYTLSFYGTGTITKSGTATGALVGTGAQRVTQTFTPTAGTLTLTVTGSVTNAQIEAGDAATSWISTAGTTVTRSIDSCTIPSANMTPWFASPGGSWFAEFDHFNAVPNNARVIGRVGSAGGVSPMMLFGASASANQFDGVLGALTVNTTTPNTIAKIATTWAPGQARNCLNGGGITTSAALATGYAQLGTSGVTIMQIVAASTSNVNGHIRRLSYWPRVLSDNEMRQVTT